MLVLIRLAKLFVLLAVYPNLANVNQVHGHQVLQLIHHGLHVHALFSFLAHHLRYSGETQQHLLDLHMHLAIALLKLDHQVIHHLLIYQPLLIVDHYFFPLLHQATQAIAQPNFLISHLRNV